MDTVAATWVANGHEAISRNAPLGDQATWNPMAATTAMRTTALPSSTRALPPNNFAKENRNALVMSGTMRPGLNIKPFDQRESAKEANITGRITGSRICTKSPAEGMSHEVRSSEPGRQVGMARKHSTITLFRG